MSLFLLHDTSSRNTPPRRSEWGISLPPDCFVSRGSISPCEYFLTGFFFTGRRCYHLVQPLSWRTTPRRLSATAYSIHSQLPSILEAVPPSATWRRAMPWWQGPTYTVNILIQYTNIQIDSHLNWRNHFDQIIPKLIVAYYIVRQMYHISYNDTLRWIYFAYFHPVASYGIIPWGNSSYTRKLQNRIIKITMGAHRRNSCRTLFKN